jgi:acyl-CoA thioester hydrolase
MGFALEWVVASSDIDELGHASNLRYLAWVQEIAKCHSEHVGYDHERYVALGAVFVVRRHELDYLAPVFEGERIEINTRIASFKHVSCVRETEMIREGLPILRASTLWAFVSTKTGRPTRIPPELIEAFGVAT